MKYFDSLREELVLIMYMLRKVWKYFFKQMRPLIKFSV